MASRRTVTTRETKVTSRRGGPAADTDAPETRAGMSMTDAVVIVTALLMLAAIVVTEYHMSQNLGGGVFS